MPPASDCRTIASGSLTSVGRREVCPRYVANAPHCRAKWIARAIRAELPKPPAVRRPGIRAGRCNAIPPEYWIAGRRSAVAGRCPSVLVLGFAALNPFYGGAIAHEAEGDSVAYSASSGRVGWVERSETHRMNQRRRGAGWQQWGCGMNTDDSRIIARFQRLTTELLAQKRLGQWHPELVDELYRTSLELEQRGLKKSPEYRNAMSRVYQQARWLAECSRLGGAGIDPPAGDQADEVIE